MRPLRREPDGFRDFVIAFSPTLLRVAYLLLRDRPGAEDAVQATLLRTYRRWDRASANPQAYSRQVLMNVYRDHWRHAKRAPEQEVVPDYLEAIVVNLSPLDAFEERDLLERTLRRLSDEQRSVLVLRFYLDLSVLDTAEALGIAEGTVRSATTRALQRLCCDPCHPSPWRFELPLNDHELEEALPWSHFCDMAQSVDIAQSLDSVDRLVGAFDRRMRQQQRRRRQVTAAVAVLAAGASLGVVAETGSSPSVGGTAMRLASYTFALPAGYHRTNAAAATKCDPVAWLQTSFFTTNPPHVGSLDTSSAIASSTSASGGCVVMALSVPYTPSGGSDPYALTSGARRVIVGGYNAWLSTTDDHAQGDQLNLDVEIPMGNGRVHDLAVGALGFDFASLIALVSAGLS